MLLLVGKTCTGKNRIQKELIKMGMEPIVTYTTRPPRPEELDGISYHFITKEDFFEKRKQGFFAETTHYKVATGDTWYYGSAVKDLTDDKVIIVNPEGLKKLGGMLELNPVSFYLLADEEVIWNRLRKRGDNAAEARRRLNSDEKDFERINNYIDFAFRNDSGLKPELLAEMILYTYRKVINKYE
ncbi:MAG: guanylate kinase [Hungatella sp.]|nr:guanylate kinase [Hungatella sp.]